MGNENLIQKLDEADEQIREMLKPSTIPDRATKDVLKEVRSLVQNAITILLGN